MSYLIAPGARTIYVDTLRRPLSPLADMRALWRLYTELKRARPVIVHTHMAKAGLLGRIAAAAYNRTRGSSPRGAGHSHLPRPRARGLFQPADDAPLHCARTTPGARQRSHRRHLAGHRARIARWLSHRAGRPVSRRSARLRARARSPPSTMRREVRAAAISMFPPMPTW